MKRFFFIKLKSDEFESIKKVDSILYRFIADFRPDVISGPITGPIMDRLAGPPDVEEIIHESFRVVFI